jgi:hypothetical protein
MRKNGTLFGILCQKLTMPSNYATSLRKLTLARIEKDHGELMPPKTNFITAYLRYLSQRDKWWLVLIHVLGLLLLFTFLRFGWFTFVQFDDKTAAALIDQRTSNVATIISMTLAVIGLLLGNLAIKDNQTYKLLFVNSRLYLILYYTLSVICCLIVISTLRDTFDKAIFEQFVLAGTYLALFILFGIGYLFRTIIKFANASNIQAILTLELLSEAKMSLRIHLLTKYSLDSFVQLMREKNVQRFRLPAGQLPVVEHGPEIPKKLIFDIKLSKLAKELAKDKTAVQKYYTTAISLNLVTGEYSSYISPNIGGPADKKMDLSGCLVTAKTSKVVVQSEEYRSYFNSKLQGYSAEGKSAKANEILLVYNQLFELQMKHG